MPRSIRFLLGSSLAGMLVLAGSGCSTPESNIALGVGATLLGSATAAHEIEQVYYLGVFDPTEQLPEAVYRITVRGQASLISNTKFASGWVPAALVDTLSSNITFGEQGVEIAGGAPGAGISTGRGLMIFGPEGFRPAPRDHRLVVIMGSDPSEFFKAVGDTLQDVTQAEIAQRNDEAARKILEELLRISGERRRIDDLRTDVQIDAAGSGKGGS